MNKATHKKSGAGKGGQKTTIEVEVGLSKGAKSTLKVAKFEIVRQLKKPAFWVAMLLTPALLGFIFLIGFLAGDESALQNSLVMVDGTVMEVTEEGLEPSKKAVVAVTDEAGVLPDESALLEVCASREECIEKVKSGEVDLYYHIPADFVGTRQVEFYHVTEELDLFNNDASLLKSILAEAASERVEPLDVIVLSGSYEINENRLTAEGEAANALGRAVVPGVILVVFFMFVAVFGNRFLMAVVEEKENRISEMILTAVNAKHLVVGKIIAMMALGVVQIVVMIVPVAVIAMLNQDNATVAMILETIEVDPVAVTMNVVLFVASIFAYAGMCVLVGSLVPTARDASSFIGPMVVAMVFPLYFVSSFLAAEPGVMAYVLSYFPLSAPIALMLRSAMGTLTTWEFAIGVIEMVVLAMIVTRGAVMTFQKNAINFSKVKLLKKGR